MPDDRVGTELEQVMSSATVAASPGFIRRELEQLERQIALLRAEQRRLIERARAEEDPPASAVRGRMDLPTLRSEAGAARDPSPAAQRRRQAPTKEDVPAASVTPPTCRPAPPRAEGRYSVLPLKEEVSIRRAR